MGSIRIAVEQWLGFKLRFDFKRTECALAIFGETRDPSKKVKMVLRKNFIGIDLIRFDWCKKVHFPNVNEWSSLNQ